ncbi:MAG: DNA repair protein RecN [Candidatus Geothermincolia bacterium]
MLSYLRVSDLALVENVEVEFHEGLNVVSGETGAGKTVLIGAIGLLLGDRADAMMVRTGAAEAVLEASFDLAGEPAVRTALEELGYIGAGECELTLWRRLPRDGKGRCTVNGRLCPVSALSEIGDMLVEVHGQNTHQALLKQASHIGYLDRFAGAAHLTRLAEYRMSYDGLRSLLAERARGDEAGPGVYSRELELLRHEIEELESAAPIAGELEEMDAQASRLRHASELWDLANQVAGILSTGERSSMTVRDLLTTAAGDLERMSSRDATLEPLAARLESLSLEAEDLAGEMESYTGTLDTDPSRLAQVEARISLLRELCRKYGGSIEAAVEYLARAHERLAELEKREERGKVIDAEIGKQREEASSLAGLLHGERVSASRSLVEAVTAQMRGLGLPAAGFEVDVLMRVPDENGGQGVSHLGPSGSDEVEFLFSPESRETPKPLRKIASGGEMSRVMLALKIVLAEADRLPVLVFDEVDAGIGGETAATIGEKLCELTRYHQVFCVTHLPQIASFADWQYQVSKDVGAGGAKTAIALLGEDERVSEICRMLGDSTGRKATAGHARDILKTSAQRKKQSV